MYLAGEIMASGRRKKYLASEARDAGWRHAIPLSHVEVSTRRYVAAHWEEPRGDGYWGFYVHDLPGGHGRVVWLGGASRTYTEARREITQYAAELGIDYVAVAP